MRIPSPREIVTRPLTAAELAAGELLPKVLAQVQHELRITAHCDYPIPIGMVPGSVAILKGWLRERGWRMEDLSPQMWRIMPNGA